MAKRALLVGLWLSLGSPAWAALGETVVSVGADREKMHGELKSFAGEGFTVHEITAPDGTLVREYVAPSGIVFGVAWRGMVPPDFALLFGSYFPAFRENARSDARRHRPLVLKTSQLVVEMGGHMRAFQGRAYVPLLLPSGTSPDVVRSAVTP